MLLRDVGDFVGDDPRQFVLPLRGQQQAGIDADEIVRQGKRIDAGVADQEKRERHAVLIGVGHDALTHGIEVLVQLHIVQHRPARAKLPHDLQTHLLLVVGAEIDPRGITHIRQQDGLRTRRRQ